MRGIYVALLLLKKAKKIRIGKLGEIGFSPGYYAYVGSAQNSLERRIERHLRRNKKLKWHIDYLLKHAAVKEVWIKENVPKREECSTAKSFAEKFSPVSKFGASDCACESHLFFSRNLEKMRNLLEKLNFVKFHSSTISASNS